MAVGIGRSKRVGCRGFQAAEDIERVAGTAALAAAVVVDSVRRSEQAAGRVVDGEGVIATQAGEREPGDISEGDKRPAVQAVSAAVGSSSKNDQRVVAAGAAEGD